MGSKQFWQDENWLLMKILLEVFPTAHNCAWQKNSKSSQCPQTSFALHYFKFIVLQDITLWRCHLELDIGKWICYGGGTRFFTKAKKLIFSMYHVKFDQLGCKGLVEGILVWTFTSSVLFLDYNTIWLCLIFMRIMPTRRQK